MKKILYIHFHRFPWDVRVDKTTRTLKNAGYDVHILGRWVGETFQEEVIDGIHIYRHGYKQLYLKRAPFPKSPFWYESILNLVKKIKPDLIIVREMYLGESAGKIAKKFNIPIIMDMAEHYPAAMRDWKSYQKNPLKKFIVHQVKLPNWIEKNSIKDIQGIMVVCDEQINRLNKEYSFSKKDMTVVHNTPEIFFKSKKDFNTHNIIFGHHGYLTSEKSLGTFVEGFLLACDEKTNIKLVLNGDGHSKEDYEKVIYSSNHSDKVIFKGKFDYSELPNILNSYDIGVIPYQVSDFNNYTIHNKIFDFMNQGVPVLTSNMRPTSRIIDETNCGEHWDMSSPKKVKEAILNYSYDKLNTYSEKGQKWTKEKYNWERDTENMINFINQYIK